MGRTTRIALLALVLAGAAIVGSGSPGSAQPAPEAGSNDWRQVAMGVAHTCGIRTSGRLFCWGDDDSGQLGDGGGATPRTVPHEVAGGATDWRVVSAANRTTCGIRAPGRLYCWGDDDTGQLGNGAVVGDQIVPLRVGAASNWVGVSVGAAQACGRRSTGRIYCWGSDTFGGLGNGPDQGSTTFPVEVAGNVTTWTSVTAGTNHACGRRSNGRIYCWGRDFEGQLGDNDLEVSKQVPRVVAGGATNWTSVDAGVAHTCGRRSTGRIYCWGNDLSGAVGDGDGAGDFHRATPALVAGGAANWTSVSAGSEFSCGRRSTGRLFCWGSDVDGRLGNGGSDVPAHAPSLVAGGATDWISIEAGDRTVCARIATRRLYCWGSDSSGQLGNGGTNTTEDRPSEVFA